MLAACMMPDLVTEITLQPLRRYHVDAAILFSDIVVPLRAVGVESTSSRGSGR
jgi:Uroporphyrinogen-III decarboxylase